MRPQILPRPPRMAWTTSIRLPLAIVVITVDPEAAATRTAISLSFTRQIPAHSFVGLCKDAREPEDSRKIPSDTARGGESRSAACCTRLSSCENRSPRLAP